MLQNYGYILQQQYDYIKFFTEVSSSNGGALDFGQIQQAALDNIQKLVINCQQMLSQNLEHQVKTLELEAGADAEYYLEAMQYLQQYPESKACHEKMAQAHVKLAELAGDDVDAVMHHYSQALMHNKELPELYSKLGDLFNKQGEYAKAIECYKVINDSFHVNKCFKAWIEIDEENPNIWLKRGDYCASVGQSQKAEKYYQNACGLSNDEAFKEIAMHKMADALTVQEGIAAQFNIMADNHNFYNFASVNAEFAAQVLGAGADEYKAGEFDLD